MKLSWKKILPLIGLTLFVYILSKLDFFGIWQIIKQMDYRFFFFLPFTIILILSLQTLKWQILLKSQNIETEFIKLFKIHLVSSYYALITPSRMGYFIKILYLQNDLKRSKVEISSSVIIDRVLDMFVLSLFALIGSFFLMGFYPNLFVSFLIFVFIFIISGLFFYSKKRAKFFTSFFKGLIPNKFRDKLKNGFNVFYDNFPDLKSLLISFFLTCATWFVIYSQLYLIALALNININYWYFIFFVPIATIVSLLPISISGLGTREVTLILIFSNYNIASESIVVLSLIGFILVYFLPALIGGILSFDIS